jgi:hypothetical protein
VRVSIERGCDSTPISRGPAARTSMLCVVKPSPGGLA